MQSRGRVRHELCPAVFVLETQALDQDLGGAGHQFQAPKTPHKLISLYLRSLP